MPETALDLVVAGTADAVLMVESEAKELPEDIMLGAVTFGHEASKAVVQAVKELAEAIEHDDFPHVAEELGDRRLPAVVVFDLEPGQSFGVVDLRGLLQILYVFPGES